METTIAAAAAANHIACWLTDPDLISLVGLRIIIIMIMV
jgi:hypothetical protein